VSKIICEICGTTYPETASHCHICGCSKDAAAEFLSEEAFVEETAVDFAARTAIQTNKTGLLKFRTRQMRLQMRLLQRNER
jgi:hypothetical protein